jgi:sterol desaturase/sphingolipid hydroxylase (fatty acid hydroxylase superfamily)
MTTLCIFFGSWLYCFCRFPDTIVHAPRSAGFVSVFNTFVLGGPLTYWVYVSVPMSFGAISLVYDLLPMSIVLTAFLHIWFYFTHRLLHVPFLFRHVHYLHHRYSRTNAYCAQFAHPVEFVLGNLAGVILAPCIFTIHRTLFVTWVLLCLNQSILAHGIPRTYHSVHHIQYHMNYGVGVALDRVFGTSTRGPRSPIMSSG